MLVIPFLIRCNTQDGYMVFIDPVSDTTNRIVSISQEFGDSNFWALPYPVYQFQYIDINQDLKKEILVGVTKQTRFDSVKRNRIFVFKHFKDEIRPLWLGSRLGMPIKDFHVDKEADRNLMTIEFERDGTFAVGRYQWDRFGFAFLKYEKRNCSFNEANKYVYNH